MKASERGNKLDKEQFKRYFKLIDPKKQPDKQFFLDLLDTDKQTAYEEEHLRAVMLMLRYYYVQPHKKKIKEAERQIQEMHAASDYSAESVQKAAQLRADIARYRTEIDVYRCFFEEPYFARMDLTDPAEGYNSYYIGKKGDVKLEIVDWRAPLAKKYYQKSQISFSIHEYDYKTILRRALRTANGRLVDFKNEFLSVRDYLTREEIAGRDEEIIFDPYLKQIIKERKEETFVRDIIETIQEKQYEIITRPERENIVVQGCAGSGKTMILLHRLSYLLYNNEKLNTRDVLVITPSDSFNSFIDELARVLELQSVKTMTVEDYFAKLLSGVGISIPQSAEREPEEYLAYLYSPAYARDVKAIVERVYGNIRGLFASEEVREFVGEVKECCARQLAAYTALKNASLRVRRAVLGEIKEKPEGGIYYTKPFREFMNGILSVSEFFSLDFDGADMENHRYMTRQLAAFFHGATLVYRRGERVIAEALASLDGLKEAVEREILDLRRYKYRTGSEEVFTYADRIERRKELLSEIEKMRARVEGIGADCGPFFDFYQIVSGDKTLVSIGHCTKDIELARWFYRETTKKKKAKYKMEGLYRSDGYAIAQILSLLGVELYPHYGYVFIDEGQDISPAEYALIRTHNPTAAFNVFGDLAQNITPYRGLKTWKDALDAEPYCLDQNYRNVNQIVAYVSEKLGISMKSIGFDGDDVKEIAPRGVNAFFADKKGLKAVIVSESAKEKYARKSYHAIGSKGNISKKKVNFMTVYESKGLEFSAVVVAEEGMSDQEKYIAYTRALMSLAVIPAPQEK